MLTGMSGVLTRVSGMFRAEWDGDRQTIKGDVSGM